MHKGPYSLGHTLLDKTARNFAMLERSHHKALMRDTRPSDKVKMKSVSREAAISIITSKELDCTKAHLLSCPRKAY
jgi:hypothetical protein